jgi:arsenate reductase
MLTVYVYRKCSTCRAALDWLDSRGIRYQEKAIRETPPTVDELRAALAMTGGDIRKLFNTSGIDYRALGLKDKLPSMPLDEAFTLLAQNGNLVKRPFVIGPHVALTGFKPELWEKSLAAS